MIYKFIDKEGTFIIENPHHYNIYFPLLDGEGLLLSSISASLGGDIKKDNQHFLTPPASILDIKNNFLCRRGFFIKTENRIYRLSHPYQDTLECGFLYHKIKKETKEFIGEILNFIPYNLPCEIMQVKIKNTSSYPLKIIPTSFIPLFGRGEKNLRDHRHVSSLLNRIELSKYGIYLFPTLIFDERGHKKPDAVYFVLGYEGRNIPPQGQFPTLEYFQGKGSLISPEAIKRNLPCFTKTYPWMQGKEVCAAFRFSAKNIPPQKEITYTLIMGITKNKKEAKKIFLKTNSPEKIEVSLSLTKKYWQEQLNKLSFCFGDKNFDNWLKWVKLQPFLRKLFGCSFLPHFDYGKGGRGWRDIWQDILSLILLGEKEVKNFILQAIEGIRIDGTNATIINKEYSFLSDRNKIPRIWCDHGIWPWLSINLYLHRYNDFDILFKERKYFSDHLISRGKKIKKEILSDYILRDEQGKIYQGSILEHILIQHLTAFFNVGKHNIIRLENADWNDGLDMAQDKGEAVGVSFLYAKNLKEIASLLSSSNIKKIKLNRILLILLDTLSSPINYNNFKEKQKLLKKYLKATENFTSSCTEVETKKIIKDLLKKSEHIFTWINKKEWLPGGFFNGYYDNKGRKVEGNFAGITRMMLTTAAFSLMSEALPKAKIKSIWKMVKKHLYDKKLKGFRLNTDFQLSSYFDLGRAFSFSYGDKENGAFFNHMVVMLAFSLYRNNFVKEGNEVLSSIYQMHKKGDIPPTIPEYFNSQGKGLYLYLTGSASWFIYTLFSEVLGIKFQCGDIIIQPKLTYENFFTSKIRVNFKTFFEGKHNNINLTYIQKKKPQQNIYRLKEVYLENKKIPHLSSYCLIKKDIIKKLKNKNVKISVELV